MKNNQSRILTSDKNSLYQQFLRIMRLKVLFLFLFTCSLFAENVSSQTDKVNICRSQGATIERILNDIENQTDYLFIYQDNVDLSSVKKIDHEGQSVEQVLNELFSGTNIGYRVDGNYIGLFLKNTNTNGVASSESRAVRQTGRTVTVTVRDAMGEVIGANVLVKGTTIGGITNMDGVAVIQGVPNNAVIQVSYVGYVTQEVALQNGQTSLSVTLREDSEALEEVVVVGYGTQAKKDITGSVAVVSRDAIAAQPVSSFAEALQGQASGVYINNGGGPAGETTIRIRGVGSVNGSDPLIIVDGIQGVNISSVNPNDIETMQVLKDASATAIYGAKAANGVIIITTKQGTKDSKVNVSYNAYVGWSEMANDGYNMLGAYDYMDFVGYGMENAVKYQGKNPESQIHSQFGAYDSSKGKADHYGLVMPYSIVPTGYSKDRIISEFGSIDEWVNSYQKDGAHSYSRSAYYQMLEDGASEADARMGTNWFDLITRKGFTQNHELSMQGGGERGTYSVGLGYMDRNGAIVNSYFKRYSARANATFNPTKHVSMGLNLNAMVGETSGENGRQGDSSVFAESYTMMSWVPAYNIGGDFAGSNGGGGRSTSALSSVKLAKNDWSRNANVNMAIFGEVKDPWLKGLTLRTQFSTRLTGGWSNTMSEADIAWNKEGSAINTFTQNSSWYLNWQWTNTATYKHTFADKHDMTLMIGSEALKDNIGYNMSASRKDYIFEDDPNTWTLSNGSSSNLSNSGGMGSKTTMFGLFFRGDYSYAGKYLATVTFRRDASSKFAEKNRWGNFPSISLGWRISDEPFMARAHETWLDDLKLRAGYGTTGNSNIGAYNYAFQFSTGSSYLYNLAGNNSDVNTAYALSALGDSNAKWETTKMLNVGFDATAFNNRFSASFDYYVKKTSDMLVSANWSSMAGKATKPNVNIGDMKNRGWDLSLGWRDRKGDWNYSFNFNISQYKNEVVKLGSSDLFVSTRLSNLSITTEGQPVGMFYGLIVEGVYTSESDVTNYTNSAGQKVLPYGIASESKLIPSSWVGRYKFRDINNDGKINSDDKTIIGNPHPDFTGGFNASVSWKNWDLSTYLYFSLGNDIFAMYEYYTMYGCLGSNYSVDRLNKSWDPVTNPDGTYPMWLGASYEGSEASTQAHTNYVKDGSYLRMQTLTLGYTLPSKWTRAVNLSKVRLYLQASNLFTITKYPGLDPEVRNGGSTSVDTQRGVDFGSYGMPRQYLFGVNINF